MPFRNHITGTGILALVLFFHLQTAYADDESERRFGAMVLGTGLISGIMELKNDNTSFRLTAGMFHIETCVSATINRYMGSGRVRPYVGIGIWSVSLIPGLITGRLVFASAPVGIQWRIKENRYLGIEADLHYFLAGLDPNGDRVEFNEDHYFVPLPGIYYKQTL